jgi:hypothetical protein
MLKALLISLTISSGADTASSVYAFKAGAVERNLFIVSTRTAPFVTEVALATAGEVWLLHRIGESHPKLAKTLAIVGIAAGALATAKNIKVGRELREDTLSPIKDSQR